jgi:hypothetical protein
LGTRDALTGRMKLGVASITFLVGVTACASSMTQQQLESGAKVSRSDAQRIALLQAPGGNVEKSEIERENGKLVWSFDIRTARGGVKEVQIDALTGDIASVAIETPDQDREEQPRHD